MNESDSPGLRAVAGDPGAAAAVFDASLDAIVLADDRLRFVDANPAACSLLGYSRAEFLALTVPDVLVDGDRARVSSDWERFRAAGSDLSGRWLRRKGGTAVEVEVRAVADVRPGLHLAIWHDLTARRSSEEALRRQQERLAEALRTSRMAFWDWDPETDRTVASDTISDLFGLPAGETLDSSAYGFRLVHADDRERHRAVVQRAGKEGGSWHHEFRIVRPRDGRVVWLEERATTRRDPATGRVRTTGLVWDVTARKLAEDRLRESDERLRAALAAAEMGTWLWRVPADEFVLGENLRRLLGTPPSQEVTCLVGFLGAVHAEDRDRVRSEFERCREEGCDLRVEFRVVRPDLSVRWLRGQGKTLAGPDGRPLSMTGACADVTERRAMEDELRRARDELERRVEERTAELRESQRRALQAERLATIGQTVTALAHEGRNTLQRADGCLGRLDLRLTDRPGERELVERTRVALRDLEQLFDDVRTYAAPIRLDRKPCDLGALWREVWAQVVAQSPGRDARLEEEPGAPDLGCEADPFRLRQVFANLFTNALEACPDPVRVAVSARAADVGGRPGLEVVVRDNGPGFAPEPLRRALEPFFTTKPKGTGLGLAIARRVVEAHGGGLTLVSDGVGARLTLTLPTRAADLPAAKA